MSQLSDAELGWGCQGKITKSYTGECIHSHPEIDTFDNSWKDTKGFHSKYACSVPNGKSMVQYMCNGYWWNSKKITYIWPSTYFLCNGLKVFLMLRGRLGEQGTVRESVEVSVDCIGFFQFSIKHFNFIEALKKEIEMQFRICIGKLSISLKLWRELTNDWSELLLPT